MDATIGPRTVTVTNPDASSATRAGGFTVTLPPPHISLVWNGKIRDRVGQGEAALAPDGQLDGMLTATVTGPGRTVKQLALMAGGAAWASGTRCRRTECGCWARRRGETGASSTPRTAP